MLAAIGCGSRMLFFGRHVGAAVTRLFSLSVVADDMICGCCSVAACALLLLLVLRRLCPVLHLPGSTSSRFSQRLISRGAAPAFSQACMHC
jgi:hypothetical protein